MDITVERHLVFELDPRQFSYFREGPVPEHANRVAVTLDANHRPIRTWWLWPLNHFVDGVEAPLPEYKCQLIQPLSIRLGASTWLWQPTRKPVRLTHYPKRLAERWKQLTVLKTIHYESLLQRLKRFLS